MAASNKRTVVSELMAARDLPSGEKARPVAPAKRVSRDASALLLGDVPELGRQVEGCDREEEAVRGEGDGVDAAAQGR